MSDSPKTVLVTGGAKRIGQQIIRSLHALGFNVVIHYRSSASAAHQLCEELNKERADSAGTVVGDLLDVGCIPNIVDAAIEQFGRLDVLINNASTFYPTPIELVNEEFWDDLMGSNLKAPTFLAKQATPHLKQHNGCIINIVDIYGTRPLANHPIYCSAKAGLKMLTKSLARDLAPEVRVNGIAPGAILWPENPQHGLDKDQLIKQIPMQRLGSAEDIAKTAKFLICDAPYITGQIISVDGGRSIGY